MFIGSKVGNNIHTVGLNMLKNTPENMYPTVSVIIPVFNQEKTITDCVTSILNLDYPKKRFEIIVVDNASTDNTAKILGQLSREFGFRTVRLEINKGPSGARNRGIEVADNQIIAFIDSDCIADPAWLKMLVEEFKEGVGAVGGTRKWRGQSNKVSTYFEYFLERGNRENDVSIKEVDWHSTDNFSVEGDIIKTLKFDDKQFPVAGEDADLGFRIRKGGHKIICFKKAIIYHKRETDLKILIKKFYRNGVGAAHLIIRHPNKKIFQRDPFFLFAIPLLFFPFSWLFPVAALIILLYGFYYYNKILFPPSVSLMSSIQYTTIHLLCVLSMHSGYTITLLKNKKPKYLLSFPDVGSWRC